MAQNSITVYLQWEKKACVNKDRVLLSMLGTVYCSNKVLEQQIGAIPVHVFQKDRPGRVVIGAPSVIGQIQRLHEDATVEILGEPDILIERTREEKGKKFPEIVKVIFVCLISFFGTAFTIMAYHNDIGIHQVFARMYELMLGKIPEGITVMEVSYSLGLSLGIILFFNHVGGRSITTDPTPIEVAMCDYEEEVNKALITTVKENQKWV